MKFRTNIILTNHFLKVHKYFLPIGLLQYFKTFAMVPFTSDETGSTKSTIIGTIGYYSKKSNSSKLFLLLYTKQSGFLVAYCPILINSLFLLYYATDWPYPWGSWSLARVLLMALLYYSYSLSLGYLSLYDHSYSSYQLDCWP